MSHSADKAIQINALVDELIKDRPNLRFVKTTMEDLGLKYSEDPIERLNIVLMSLHPQIKEKGTVTEL